MDPVLHGVKNTGIVQIISQTSTSQNIAPYGTQRSWNIADLKGTNWLRRNFSNIQNYLSRTLLTE